MDNPLFSAERWLFCMLYSLCVLSFCPQFSVFIIPGTRGENNGSTRMGPIGMREPDE